MIFCDQGPLVESFNCTAFHLTCSAVAFKAVMSNYQYVKAVSCEPATHNRVWRCTVQFSHLGERVELHMHNLPEGLNVFMLHFPLPEESE